MPITLTPIAPLTGEDMTSSPQFQMVPVGQFRTFRMTGNERGLATLVGRTGNVVVSMPGSHGGFRELRLYGNMIGYEELRWTTGEDHGPIVLGVGVSPPRRLRIAFRFVDDGGAQVSRRPAAEVAGMVRAANEILTPQANVTVEVTSTRPLRLNHTLGRVADDRLATSAPSRDMTLLASHNDAAAEVTVYFVREYDIAALPGDENGRSRAELGMIVLEDRMAADHALALVHELTHSLGATGHSAGHGDLMVTGFDANNQPGRRLNRQQIILANPLRGRH